MGMGVWGERVLVCGGGQSAPTRDGDVMSDRGNMAHPHGQQDNKTEYVYMDDGISSYASIED